MSPGHHDGGKSIVMAEEMALKKFAFMRHVLGDVIEAY